MEKIKIGSKIIGRNEPCFVVAEAGSNHNREMSIAKELIDSAVESKADAIKFQTYKAEYLYSKKTPQFDYLKDLSSQSTIDLIKSIELPREWHLELKEYCEKKGIVFFSSPFDFMAVDELEEINAPAYKIASFEIVDLDLIKYCAKTQKPIIISTGMANYEEIEQAINSCLSVNNSNIILLQCSSLYPAPAHIINLNAMNTLDKMFGYINGLSDHSLGTHIALGAVALGAKMIEKHFTLDRTMKGPDHPFAIEPNELSQMVKQIRDIESAMGNGRKVGPAPEESEMYKKARRSIIAKTNIKKGEILTKDKLIAKRPGFGIRPKMLDNIIGMKATTNIEEDSWITWDMLK